MASSKQEGTSAAAEQLGSMSLGGSAERMDNETEPAVNNGTPTKLCSACRKKSDSLKKCTSCKCVWYCDKDCQNRHWREHKRECKPIKKILDNRGGKLDLGTEKDVGPLEKLPPQEECPICMLVLPIHPQLHSYFNCCGKSVCCGCALQHQIKNEEWAEREKTPLSHTCPFCRKPVSKSNDENLARLGKRVQLKDPNALIEMAAAYGYGHYGVPVDEAKCVALYRESADLGFSIAQCALASYHYEGGMGLEPNKEEELKYLEKAAEGGHVLARNNLGCEAASNGDYVAAMRHWRLSASGGNRLSIRALIERFEFGFLRHGDLADTLQAFYLTRAELWNKGRVQHIAYLKRNGKYNEEYDL